MVTMEYNQPQPDASGDANLSRTLSNHTESVTRRSQARVHLAAKLRDRTTHTTNACPPFLEINTNTRDVSPTGLLARRPSGQSSGYLRGRRNVVSASAQVRKSNTGKRTGEECTGQSGEQWSQYMTLSQVHKILRPYREDSTMTAQRRSSHFPEIRINIAPDVTQSYPNIKVTVSNKDTLGSLAVFGSNIKHDKTGRSKSALTKTNKEGVLPQMLPHMGVTSAPGRNHGAAQILYNLDRKQMKSADKTRQWIAANPLGSERVKEDEDRSALELDVIKPPQTQQLGLDIVKRAASRHPNVVPQAPDHNRNMSTSHSTARNKTVQYTRPRPDTAVEQTEPHHDNRTKQSPDGASDDGTITPDDSGEDPWPVPSYPIESNTVHELTDAKDKHKKSVRFGSKNWIIKDDNYLFE